MQQIKLGKNSEKHVQFLGPQMYPNVLGKFSKSLFGIKCLVGSVEVEGKFDSLPFLLLPKLPSGPDSV